MSRSAPSPTAEIMKGGMHVLTSLVTRARGQARRIARIA
eukprot:CAMPEP_0197448340 /NCGR_PEP_ID=MMETSP1175-20131217/17100_1 /TAXON_ID=1003142 /ORGANISM="Triceratium dubium, Strain CCMP147" /LENGTH=38 /DNA_ID= /DNA_START= /DNA_END= /DNA_ORIENTATION=